MKYVYITCNILVALMLWSSGNEKSLLYAFKAGSSTAAGQQRNAEKGLKDNKYFIYYIDATITNYGSSADKAAFKAIIQRDILSQLYYMRFMFHKAWREIRKTQKALLELYAKKLDEEIATTRALLHEFAPYVIHAEDALARRYLSLGYRNTAHARIDKNMADHYHRWLFSMRLYKYVRAMKKVKEAKRFALLAFIRIHEKPEDKIKVQQLQYEKIRKKIALFAKEGDKERYFLLHRDSYYKVKDTSFYEEVWENPGMKEFKDYNIFLKSDN